jgi:hypothetical protein
MTSASTEPSARTGIVVVAPTTDEPILIQRLAVMAKLPTSRVVLGNEMSTQCEGWTKDYNNLMRPDAPARALLGAPESGGFRLVVSADVDHGKSWMLPVLTAHLASAHDLPATDKIGQARALIWATGAVGIALAESLSAARVIDDDYHLKSKVDRSRALFADAAHAGTPVICLVPRAAGAAEAATWLAAVLKGQPHHIRIIGDLAEAADVVRRFARRGVLADLDAPELEPVVAPETTGPGTGLVPVKPTAEPPREEGPPTQTHKKEAGTGPTSTQDGAGDAAKTLTTTGGSGASAQTGASTPETTPRPATSFPKGVAALLIAGGVMTVSALAYMALTPAPGPRPPVTPTPIVTPAPGPLPEPVGQPTPSGAAVRLGLLRAGAGRSCQALIMDMQPRFDEAEQVLSAGQAGVEIDRTQVCGLTIAGLNQVNARFQTLGREMIVPSLSQGNRIIFNPTASASAPIVIELSGAQTGQISLALR